MSAVRTSGGRFIIHDAEKNIYYGVEAFAEYFHPSDFELTEEQARSLKTIEHAFGRGAKLTAIRAADPEIYMATGSHVVPPPKRPQTS